MGDDEFEVSGPPHIKEENPFWSAFFMTIYGLFVFGAIAALLFILFF